MIQHLKILMHCNKNITIHQHIAIMAHDWQNVLLKVILTLVVNWHLCLVSHNQITFIPFCECINHHKNSVWPQKTNQNLCYTQLCIPIILNTKCIDILKFISVHVLTSHVLQCINASIYHTIFNTDVEKCGRYSWASIISCNTSIYHKFHHAITILVHIYLSVTDDI